MTKPRVLILDDQGQYLRSLDRALKSDADLVLTEILSAAQEVFAPDFDLVLTDIRLDETREDDRQGLDFIRFVRSRDAAIPVIAMSALDAPDVEEAAVNAGATRFLRKPIMVSALRALISELTTNHLHG
jgi:DNA-binding NtrC family response regulator